LWVGERATRAVLDQIADVTTPGSAPLPTSF
ncbi:MAG TPA: alpha/beta hydrolase, partial [Candidatus Aquiluna sp.]|nr:alpha/beta hydrolase [Aquiluna sp.]